MLVSSGVTVYGLEVSVCSLHMLRSCTEVVPSYADVCTVNTVDHEGENWSCFVQYYKVYSGLFSFPQKVSFDAIVSYDKFGRIWRRPHDNGGLFTVSFHTYAVPYFGKRPTGKKWPSQEFPFIRGYVPPAEETSQDCT